jgi:hypothetical protein
LRIDNGRIGSSRPLHQEHNVALINQTLETLTVLSWAMEQIVFPIPEMCEYLTNDTKVRVFNTTECDDQGSKVAAFFEGVDDTFDEMKWQKKLQGQPFLFWVSSHMSIWSQILFNLAVIINLIVAFFYPFDTDGPAPDPGTHL